MPSVDALATSISVALAHIRALGASIASSRQVARELRERLAKTGATGRAGQFEAIESELEGHQAQVLTAVEQVEAMFSQAKALSGEQGPGVPETPTGSTPGRPFKPMRTDPEKVRVIHPYVGEPIAYATLYDEDGHRLLGIHNAGNDGPAKDASWHVPWGSYARLRRHVEPHAAARMGRDGHRQLAMYINMKPCSYPDGCKQNLRALFPKGSTLFVHQVFADGSSKVHPFPGTGAALRSSDDDEG